MDQPPEPELALPPGLRFLKGLVIVLTLTMILGVITIVALLVIRIPQMATPAPTLPPELSLPEGMVAGAVTMGRNWIAVVANEPGGAERILIFGLDGQLRQDIAIQP